MLAGETEAACGRLRRVDRRALLAGVVALGGLAGCSPIPGGYRYELFVEIEVDGRRYSGSGVRETVTRDQWAFPDQGVMLTRRTRGEAFWIDVPGKPTLFVILPAFDGAWIQEWNPNPYLTRTRYVRENYGKRPVIEPLKKAELSPAQLPALVYFKNITDSASAMVVDPLNFASVYGPGVRVTRAWIERTRAPMTRGIKKKVPWFKVEAEKASHDPMIVSHPHRYTFEFSHFYSWGWL